MKAAVKAYGVSLMIAFLFVSLVQPLCSAAQTSSQVLGSGYGVNSHEVGEDSAVAAMIATYSLMDGYDTANWFGSQTTTDKIYQAAASYLNGTYDEFSMVFYIGHGLIVDCLHFPYEENQWAVYDDNGNYVYDNDIFHCGQDYSQNPIRFVFLWSCEQGNVIGGYHSSGYEYGMPFAWLHTTSLSADGYKYPDGNGRAFLGFCGGCPFLTDKQGGVLYACESFLDDFYSAALSGLDGYNTSVNSALDYATRLTWPGVTDFGHCVLYTGFGDGHMVVYGDGGMCLGDLLPPDVAITSVVPQKDGNFTKTAVGWNYCMNVSVTAANLGGESETFNVTACVDEPGNEWSINFQTESVTLAPGSSANLTFTWVTNYTFPVPTFGNRTISAYASPVPNELNTTNNWCDSDSVVALTIPGDITGQNSSFPDYWVNGVDLNTLLAHFGGWMGHNDTNRKSYFPNADFLNNGGPIAGQDLNILLSHFGNSTTP